MKRSAAVLGSASVLLGTAAVRAEPAMDFPIAPPVPESLSRPPSASTAWTDRPPAPYERPFLYLTDPSLPAFGHVAGGYSAAYTSTSGASRPLAANASRAGAVHALSVETSAPALSGPLARFAPWATGMVAPARDGEAGARGAFHAGVRALVTPPDARPFRASIDVAFVREFGGSVGGFVRATASVDAGRLRLATMAHAEKIASTGRDEVDLYGVAGASVRAIDALRVGAEYVVQDLEDAWERAEAEGGVRHFAGPTVAARVAERAHLTAGPAFGLSRTSPPVLGRAAFVWVF